MKAEYKSRKNIIIWSLTIFVLTLWIMLFLIPYSQYHGSIQECMVQQCDVSVNGYEICLRKINHG